MSSTPLARRRDAARRLAPIECSSCGKQLTDPWPHRCDDRVHADAWLATMAHLAYAHLTPRIPADVARELWRRGGRDRDMIAALADAGGVIG